MLPSVIYIGYQNIRSVKEFRTFFLCHSTHIARQCWKSFPDLHIKYITRGIKSSGRENLQYLQWNFLSDKFSSFYLYHSLCLLSCLLARSAREARGNMKKKIFNLWRIKNMKVPLLLDHFFVCHEKNFPLFFHQLKIPFHTFERWVEIHFV